jgi:hypothetical protein
MDCRKSEEKIYAETCGHAKFMTFSIPDRAQTQQRAYRIGDYQLALKTFNM